MPNVLVRAVPTRESRFALLLASLVALAVGFALGRLSVPRGEARAANAPPHCRVVRVTDGDTLVVTRRGNQERVRLLRIDAPERNEPGYRESKEALRGVVEGRELAVEFERPGVEERGRYGRLLAYVLADGVNVNVEMVRVGRARFWTKYGAGRLAKDFRRAEAQARAARRGLWAR